MKTSYVIDGMDLRFIRAYDLINPELLKYPITIIGAGAVGSNLTLMLARMGFSRIKVIDFDVVSIENMNAQGYGLMDIDQPKVVALKRRVMETIGIEIEIIEGRYEKEVYDGIIICAADSMAVRRKCFEAHTLSFQTPLFMDSRMAIEKCQLYAYNPMVEKDQKDYLMNWYEDKDAVQEACTNKAVSYTANILSGMMTRVVKAFLTKEYYPKVMFFDIKGFDLETFKVE